LSYRAEQAYIYWIKKYIDHAEPVAGLARRRISQAAAFFHMQMDSSHDGNPSMANNSSPVKAHRPAFCHSQYGVG
jgi:hypothetical protein